MSDSHAAHHGTSAALPFTEQEMQQLHKSDIQAGTMVIMLLTAIFIIGLLLYGTIDAILLWF
jgi:hypothetical protein